MKKEIEWATFMHVSPITKPVSEFGETRFRQRQLEQNASETEKKLNKNKRYSHGYYCKNKKFNK